MVLTFREGRQPLSRVVSLLFSASYPQAARSYYLFFYYLIFNYLSVGVFDRRFWVRVGVFDRKGVGVFERG